MDRRDFLKTTSTFLAATTLPGVQALAAEQPTAGRVILPMNRGWRYSPHKVEGAEAIDFDDSIFVQVVIPHTNVTLPWHSFDDKDYEFISTYRRRFKTPPAAAKGKRVFVDFEGAMTASTIWINGISLGEYKGGFTPFSFDLTGHLRSPMATMFWWFSLIRRNAPIFRRLAMRSTISRSVASIAKSL